MPSLICIPIVGPTLAEARQQLSQAKLVADTVELRLDLFSSFTVEEIRQLRQAFSIPMILTCRSVEQGGKFKGSEEQRVALLYSLLSVNPDYMDVEYHLSEEIIRHFQKLSPQTKWILSWHHFHETPQDLEAIFNRMQTIPADIYKIAVETHSICDALRLLCFAKKVNHVQPKLAAMGMGEFGQYTRILSPIVSCPLTFAALNPQLSTVPGQLDVHTLLNVYHFRQLNSQTELFGLIGHPVEHSRSHLTHNAVLRQLGLNAVYVKFPVGADELEAFLGYSCELNLKGLSVTMPHKQTIRPFLTQTDSIGACNTIVVQGPQLIGFNTDGLGALNALKIADYANQKMIVLGAGGTATAIAYEAQKRGIQVHILNRTSTKGESLAREINGTAGHFRDFATLMQQGYNIVIQATSVGMSSQPDALPLDLAQLRPGTHVLDVVSHPIDTSFIRQARRQGCIVQTGIEMFIHQAVLQFQYWLEEGVDPLKIESILRQELNETSSQSCLMVYRSQLKGTVGVPPSKSHSIRAVLLGGMAAGQSTIKNLLPSPDVMKAIQAIKLLGAAVHEYDNNTIEIMGVGGRPLQADNVIDVGNSGQVLRFVGALSALSSSYTVLTGDASIRSNRPIQPLLEGLRGLGAFAESTRQNGLAPMIVKGPLKAGKATLSGEDSQPVSALLMAAAFVEGKTEINVKRAGEKPWIALTLSWLDRLGVQYHHHNFEKFTVLGHPIRPGFHLTIPGDWSSAAFPLVAALVTRSCIKLENVDFQDVQGDKCIVPILRQMGARIEIDDASQTVYIQGDCQLKGQTIDLNAMIDAVTILAVLGCFAEGETHLINGAIARQKECNRLTCITHELRKMGARIVEKDDGLIIYPSRLYGTIVESHGDHRVALSLIVAGMGAEGETCVRGIECTEKSYPDFLASMIGLGAAIKRV